ncbi:synaptogyrin-2 [Spea bombifrons]|uniref:synaptogyrin-2 n=1 Tax=Spea bombifrons TaxID=233779 RepID=UPI00234A7C5B|nr:synaptogyrin-2 [Spea bombifrons]
METGAYGAAGAGGSFNLKQFLMRPESILRVASAIFALIVFACILTDGYPSDTEGRVFCIFNHNSDACHYGVGIGTIAFLGSLLFLGLDAYFPTISNVAQRRHIVLADLGFSALWSFLWFVGFCFLANQWASTNLSDIHIGQDNARAAIAFSFFSILSWIPLAFMAYKRYKLGVDDFNPNYVDPSLDTTSPYPPYPDAVGDNYQRPPFTNQADTGDGYKPPLY